MALETCDARTTTTPSTFATAVAVLLARHVLGTTRRRTGRLFRARRPKMNEVVKVRAGDRDLRLVGERQAPG